MNAYTELIIRGELTKKLSIRVNGYSFSQGGQYSAIFLENTLKPKGSGMAYLHCLPERSRRVV